MDISAFADPNKAEEAKNAAASELEQITDEDIEAGVAEFGGDTPEGGANLADELEPEEAMQEKVRAERMIVWAGTYADAMRAQIDAGTFGGVEKLKNVFLAEATKEGMPVRDALATLKEQVLLVTKQVREHSGVDAAKEADLKALETSFEIATEATSDAGKAFLAKLEAGAFSGVEEANTALDALNTELAASLRGLSGPELDTAQAKINAEFNLLFGAVSDRFEKGTKGSIEASDDEIDDALAGLG